MVLMIGIMLGYNIVGLSAEGLPICKTSDSLVMEEEGKEMSFELSCTNIMWDKYETNMGVLIALDPVAKLKICVDSGDDSCVPEAKASKLNMTRGHQNYTVRLLAEEEGITCVKLGSTYMVGNELQDPKAVELLLSNYNDKELERDTALAEDIPEVYTHIFEVEVDAEPSGSKIGVKSKNRSEERAADDFESEEVEMVNGSLIEESYTKMVDGESALWEEVIVLTRAIENTLMARGTHFSKIFLLLGLASANWLVGTGISWGTLVILKDDLASMWRQCSCLDQVFSVQAWKVGLLCQVFYLPIISFALAKLFFVTSHGNCKRVMDLSKLGLFLLGTAPGNTGSIYLADLWNGNLELSVALVLLSTLLSPLTYLLWWNTLGKVLNYDNGATDALAIPIGNIVELGSLMIIPILAGMYMADKFPSMKKVMEQVRKPVIVIGLLGMVVIFYFQYRHFFKFLSSNHIMASALLAVSSFILSGFSAYLCKLKKEDIISIAINSCVRNATLSYAVVFNALDVPSYIYAGIPSNAQVLFTSAPIVIAWVAWQAGKRLHTVQMRRRTTGGVNQKPLVQAFVEQKEEVPMLRVSNIKEAWTNQDLRPLWC